MNLFIDELAKAASEVIRRVERVLVVLQNGHHGVGAGIIWSRDPAGNALVLTNHHILGRSPVLQAGLQDGTSYTAEVVSKDRTIDLALLRMEHQGLPTASIADSRLLRVGQLVFAVGHPWGQRNAVTTGMISSLARMRVQGSPGEIDVIRSDARLAPGNSGGPLVNANGAVIGINTMILGGDQGIALASHVASNFVREAVGLTVV